MSQWTPTNLQDWVNSNPEEPFPDSLESRPTGHKNHIVVQCPGCGVWVPPVALVDLRGKPRPSNPRTGKVVTENWACDGCWTKWLREEWFLPHKGGKRMKKSDWVELNGAPTELIDKFKNRGE